MKYTIKDFHKQYRNDVDCLEYIYRQRYPEGATCASCQKTDSFYPVEGRRSYACVCGRQIYPTAGTIFHKSSTSLKSWFFAMFLITNSKNGVSAKELQRHIGVTYKCAWRMGHQIRQLLRERGVALQGTVEVDETYIGGWKPGKRGRGAAGKAIVVGAVERGGSLAAKVIPNITPGTLVGYVEATVIPQSTVITDELKFYYRLKHRDFLHHKILHRKKQYVDGPIHTNTIEGFWSQLKRSIHGTFHHVSGKHLQRYVNEFAYRYNRRKSPTPMFCHLIASVSEPHGPAV